MTLVIGLTGSIASGKSTVSNMFKDFNIHVIDADKIAREVVYPAEEAYLKIVDLFGSSILLENKTIDRKMLGKIIFADNTMREKLNRIVHPAIRQRMLKQRDVLIQADEKCVVLDIPLLFESKLSHFVDKTVVVYVDEKTQLKRLMERDGFTIEEANQRIKSQIPVKEKANLADAVIDNNGTIKNSHDQLKKLLKSWEIIK